MTPAKQRQCLAILTKTITAVPVDWSDIVKAVEAEMTIKNWLHVRGVLQYMLNQKQIARVDDVFTERYYKVTAK